jgi:RHS repeat-associated protein
VTPNRVGKSLALFCVVFTLGSVSAQAQTSLCAAWANVIGWQGQYTLTASGSGVQVGVWTVTVDSSATANLNLSSAGACVWMGAITDPMAAGAFNSHGMRSCSPPAGGTDDETWVGSGPAGSSSLAGVAINQSNQTYRFLADMVIPVDHTTTSDCGGSGTDHIPAFPLYAPPFGDWSFPLPDAPQQLSGTVTALGFEASFGAIIPWTITFTLTPILSVDDPCKKDGGSSIGCQNQSLGEDIPMVGTGFFLHYQGDRSPDRMIANPVAVADALAIGGWTLNVHHAYDPASDTLFLGDGGQRSAWQLAGASTYHGNYLVTSEDGSEIYLFDPASGHHLQTLKPLTGAVKYQFGYDAAGTLVTVTDGSGNVTTIQRDSAEHATAIVSPFSQVTTLSLDSNNFLSQVTDPAGDTASFINSKGGLIASRTDGNGNVYRYTYDTSGKLTNDADSAGGFTSLSRTDATTSYTVTTATALGRTSTYQVATNVFGEQFTNTWPDGLQATMTTIQQAGQLMDSSTLPDGTRSSTTAGPDPRWGLQAPIPGTTALTFGSLTANASATRAVTLGDPANPFSLTRQTDTDTVNGRTYTSVFTASTNTYVDTTPAGRQTTQVLDSLERPSSVQIGTLQPLTFSYDSQGHLATITQGTRTTSLTYDGNGFLAGLTDPLSQTTTFTRDAAGRLVTSTLPDGRAVGYTSDANGNLTSVAPPGTPAHAFTYTSVDLPASYTPPVVSGSGGTAYAYDADRNLTTITRPDGATIRLTYDSAGRLSTEVTPTATVTYTYSATTGNLTSESIQGGETLTYGYDGPLETSAAWAGAVAGSVGRAYDNNLWRTSRSINSGNTVAFSYDTDGLLTQAGALMLTYDANGQITSTNLGSAQDSWTFNGYGELVAYTANSSGSPVYSASFSRDGAGRIITKQETINGMTTSSSYTYDAAGRLTQAGDHSYTYDSNSNRLMDASSPGTVTGTYDAQDRLLTYGTAFYTYSANGELVSRTDGTQITSYQYDVWGNLVAVTLPDGRRLSYVIDGANHRVGKQVNGVLVMGFLYDGDRVVAQVDGNNQLVSQFIYATRSDSPDYLLQGGVAYRILADQLGSPRLVVNTANGQIAQEIDYDTFGNVINDTNPGFQPFGFAGGLYDRDTKLVRFGARDYDPSTGRWTTKDPILFAGGDTNLYGYVLDDPVNLTDATGLDPCTCEPRRRRHWSVKLTLLEPIFPGPDGSYVELTLGHGYRVGERPPLEMPPIEIKGKVRRKPCSKQPVLRQK